MFRIMILIFVLKTIAFCGYCDYESCETDATQASQQQQLISIDPAYQALGLKFDSVALIFDEYLSAIENQNTTLENLINVRALNSETIKKINFLLEKIVRQKDVQIDVNLQKDLLKFQQSLIETKDLK